MKQKQLTLSCPIPIEQYPVVLLAHGGGGKLMNSLIKKMFMPEFSEIPEKEIHDSAVVDILGKQIAFTTDSYVVQPLFFPGGDIGSLSVYGTVNDLSMSGAKPVYISTGFIIEEGFPMETLWKIVHSMKQAAMNCGLRIVTGDTKVVDKGKGDGIFINTSGIGFIEHKLKINPASIREGDSIILSGDIGRHGIAIMAVREGLEFETQIQSDCAPLNDIVQKIIENNIEIHCMRDLTRGGLSSALVELAESSELGFSLDEKSIPVKEDVQGACEILGFDPMYVANEGRFVLFVPRNQSDKVLDILKSDNSTENASNIGNVNGMNKGIVTMKSKIGASRIVDMLSGEQLPRIC
jgi:hydrogenase expression/formation protein HypE